MEKRKIKIKNNYDKNYLYQYLYHYLYYNIQYYKINKNYLIIF